MSTLSSFLTQRSPSDLERSQALAIEQQRIANQQAAENNAYGSFDQDLRAAIDATVPGYIARQYVGASFEPDPTFQWDEKTFNEVAADLPREYWPSIAQAQSRGEADYLALTYQGQMDSRQRLANAGWSGTALSIGASVIDPAYLAAGFLTGGLITAGRVATMSGLMVNGLAASVPFAGIAEYKASQDPSITQLDVLKEAAGGFFFQAGVSRFAGSSIGVRTAAGALGMSLPSVGLDIAQGDSFADALKMGASQLVFGGLFGAMSPRDMTPASLSLNESLNTVGTNAVKDAAKIQLALPPGAIRVGGGTQGVAVGALTELPPVLTINGYQFFTEQLTDAERTIYSVMTGYGEINPTLKASIESKHGPIASVGQQLRDVFQAKIDLGENPNAVIRELGNVFQEFDLNARTIDLPAQRIGGTIIHQSYTDRVATMMSGLFDEGGEAFAQLSQFDSYPQITDATPVTPRGEAPSGAPITGAAMADLNTEAPFIPDAPVADISIDEATRAKYQYSQALGSGLNIPITVAQTAGTPYNKMSSNQLVETAKSVGVNVRQPRSGIIRDLEAMGKTPPKAAPIEKPKKQPGFNYLAESKAKAAAPAPSPEAPAPLFSQAYLDNALNVTVPEIPLGSNADISAWDSKPITPRGTVPEGARLSPAAAADIAAEAPVTIDTPTGSIDISPSVVKLFEDSAPLTESLGVPLAEARANIAGSTPLEKLTSDELVAMARAAGVNPDRSRADLIKSLSKQTRGTAAERLEAWTRQLEANAQARMRASRGIPRGRGTGAVDTGAIADTAVIIAAKVIRLGAKAAQKLESVVRTMIANAHPDMVGREDEIIAQVRPMLAMGVDETGNYNPDTFAASIARAKAATPAEKPAAAAQAPTPRVPRENRGRFGFFPDTIDKGPSWLARKWIPRMVQKITHPFSTYLGGSADPELRTVARMGMTDILPTNVDGKNQTVREGAVQWARAAHDRVMAGFNSKFGAAYAAHVVEARVQGAKPLSWSEFASAAGRAVRRTGDPTITPSLRAAADATQAAMDSVLKTMIDHGVPGAEHVARDATWLKRMADENLVGKLMTRHGRDFLEQMIYDSIIDTGSSEGVRRSIAKAWLANASGYNRGEGFLSMNPETLFARVKAVNPNLDAQQIEEIRNVLLPGRDKNAGAASLKNRILMDETRVHTAPDGSKLTLEDMLVNDVTVLTNRVTKSALGASAESAILADFGESLGRTFTSTDDIITHFKTKWGAQGHPQGPAAASDELNYLESMFKLIRGEQVHAFGSEYASFLRGIGNMNFAQRMSNVASGVTNYAEISSALSNAGVTAFFETHPEAHRVFLEILNGKLDSETAREMAAMGFGVGKLNRPKHAFNTEEGITMSKFENFTAKAAHLASDVSLQSYGQDNLELCAGIGLQQRLISEALAGGINVSDFRAKAMGWTPEDVAAIESQIKAHHTTDANGIRHPNLEKWTDIQAAARFTEGIRLTVNRIIQRGDKTQIALWMSSPWGKVLMQLKTFSTQATVGKLAFNARARDTTAAVDLVTSSVAAAIGYVGATYLRSALRPDAEEYLRQNLKPDKVLLAGFSRAAYSGLIPSLVDTAAGTIGQDEVFSYAKNSGSSNNFITGNATYQWGASAAAIPKALIHWADPDQEVNMQDINAVQNGVWWPNVLGMKGVIERWTQHLPKQPRRETVVPE